MNVDGTSVRAFRIYGLVLVVGGVVLAGLSLVVSSLTLAVGLFVLAPLVWLLGRRQELSVNLGLATLMIGMVLLVVESGEQSVLGWIGPIEIGGFVVVCGVLQIALAPWLASQDLNVL